MSEPWKDKQRLKKMYWDKSMSQKEIADVFDLCRGTIQYWMQKHDIDTRKPAERPPKINVDKQGRERFASTCNGKQGIFLHHRLIMVAEHGFEALKDHIVHHKNGIPWDNRPENLELITRQEHQIEHTKRGDIPRKLEKIDVKQIRKRYENGESVNSLAKEYDYHEDAMRRIVKGDNYSYW